MKKLVLQIDILVLLVSMANCSSNKSAVPQTSTE